MLVILQSEINSNPCCTFFYFEGLWKKHDNLELKIKSERCMEPAQKCIRSEALFSSLKMV